MYPSVLFFKKFLPVCEGPDDTSHIKKSETGSLLGARNIGGGMKNSLQLRTWYSQGGNFFVCPFSMEIGCWAPRARQSVATFRQK